MTNKQRRAIVDEAKSKGYTGSYIDLFKQAMLNPSENQEVLMADTDQEKKDGLRPYHEAGRTDASMAFTDVPPNTPFNTVGMKRPIDIKKYDEQGHLVKSYESVPPGLTNIDSGPAKGTVLETPSRMQEGGVRDNTRVSIPELQDQEAFNPYSDLHLPPSGRVDYSGANVEDLLGVGSLLKAPVKAAAKNTYKINPFARKSIPVDESTWVRGIGKEGLDDLRSSGIVRSKNDGAYPQPYFGHSDGIKKVISSYGGGSDGVVLTLKGAPMKGVGAFPTGNPFIQTPAELIKLGDPRLRAYSATPHWLKGYRQINQTGGYNPGEYMNEMQPKVFPNQKRDAQWVNYTTEHDFAGRFPGETKSNRELGLEISNRNTVPLPPTPTVPKELRTKAQEGATVEPEAEPQEEQSWGDYLGFNNPLNATNFVNPFSNLFGPRLVTNEIKKRITDNIQPHGYKKNDMGPVERVKSAVIDDIAEPYSSRDMQKKGKGRSLAFQERTDLYKMMLGLDQVHNSIEKSEYAPTKGDPDKTYYKSNFTEKYIRSQLDEGREPEDLVGVGYHAPRMEVNVLGNFTIDQGEDEKGKYISYYDRWDLNPISDGKKGPAYYAEEAAKAVLGLKGPEVYGRVYYNYGGYRPMKAPSGIGSGLMSQRKNGAARSGQ